MSEQRKAVIKNADMEEKMQQDAVDIASKALSEYNIEKVRVSAYYHSIPKASFSTLTYFWMFPITGCCCVYQEGIRSQIPPDLARHCR